MMETMSAGEYKTFHESFMQNNNGTTHLDVMCVIVPTSFTTFLTMIAYISVQNPMTSLYKFCIDFLLIILPIILSVTLLANNLYFLISTLTLISLPIIWKLGNVIYINKKECDILSIEMPTGRREFISNVRAIINVLTAVCILAVDFQIFPRKFAKTENYGFGLMDTGVGLYVFGNGVIAPEIYKQRSLSFNQRLKSQFIGTIPLLILGISRFIIVKEIDYQEHISEYGVHWNFFITLAFTKLIGTMLLHVISIDKLLIYGFILSTMQELLLYSGLSEWVFSDISRDNFIAANREGISSVLGYVALYLFSVHIGKEIYIKTSDMKTNISVIVRLACYSVLLTALTYIYHDHFGVSRRLANFGYSTFVLSLSVPMTMLFLMIELFLIVYSKLSHNTKLISTNYIPLIYKSTNYNGLIFFLVANFGTGLVNLSIRTMLVSPVMSLMILIVYMFAVCSLVTLLMTKEIKLKIW